MFGRILSAVEDEGGGYLGEALSRFSSIENDLKKKEYTARIRWMAHFEHGKTLLAVKKSKDAIHFLELAYKDAESLSEKERQETLTVLAPLDPTLATQTPEPAPLAHGDVPGEPHHHLKIENEYVRVYYVEVPPHENTQLHQHDHDYLFVTLGNSDVINAVRDKPEVHLVLKDGETHFTRGNFAHIARNLADAPFRNITIELLKTQGEAHNECGDIIAGQGAAICDPPFVSVWDDTQFETTESKLDLVWIFSKKEEQKDTVSKLAFLVVGLEGPEVKIKVKGRPPKTLHAGEIEWFDAGSDVQFSGEGDSNRAPQFLRLTFKDSAVNARH